MVRSFLVLLLAVMLGMPSELVHAKESERFIFVPVEYSDNLGKQEVLEVMIKDGNIYVDAMALAKRLGYQTENTEDYISIYNTDNSEVPVGNTQFFYGNTVVKHRIFEKMIGSYEAPFPSLNNDRGSWIPLEYSLLMLNSGMMILDNIMLIDIPCKNIMDYCYDLWKSMESYNFIWNMGFEELGRTEEGTDIAKLDAMIKSFEYTLKLDGSAWSHLFRAISLNSLEYGEDCAETLAVGLCCESAGEFGLSMEKVESGEESFLGSGQIGRRMERYPVTVDSVVDDLYMSCKELLERTEEENSPAVVYSRAYQALKKATDREIWFSDIGSKSIEVHKEAEYSSSVRDIGMDVKRAVEYRDEFNNQDEFAFGAVMHYLDCAENDAILPGDIPLLIDESVGRILRYSEMHSPARFLIENMEEWYSDSLPDLKAMGKQVMLNVYIRDAFFDMKSAMPSKKEKIEMVEMVEMLLYSLEFQESAFVNCRKLLGEIFENPEKFLAEDWYGLSQYCYTYLKSCYTARCIGMNLFKRSLQKEVGQWEAERQNKINYEVSKAMVQFKTANKTNKKRVYGFLPADNETYLNEYDNRSMIAWIDKQSAVKDVSSILHILPNNFSFSSGAGAWATVIHINTDGNFEGQYQDTNIGESSEGYPNGTVYICNFIGKFSEPERIGEYVYSMKLEKLGIKEKPGEIFIEEGVRYVCSEPYGFDRANEFYLYCPGIQISELEAGFVNWLGAFVDARKVENLPYYGIYNRGGKQGFVGVD